MELVWWEFIGGSFLNGLGNLVGDFGGRLGSGRLVMIDFLVFCLEIVVGVLIGIILCDELFFGGEVLIEGEWCIIFFLVFWLFICGIVLLLVLFVLDIGMFVWLVLFLLYEFECLKFLDLLVCDDLCVLDWDMGVSKGIFNLCILFELVFLILEIWGVLDFFFDGRILDLDMLGLIFLGVWILVLEICFEFLVWVDGGVELVGFIVFERIFFGCLGCSLMLDWKLWLDFMLRLLDFWILFDVMNEWYEVVKWFKFLLKVSVL